LKKASVITALDDFDFTEGVYYLSRDYVTHSVLPVIYSYTNKENIDISNIINLVSNKKYNASEILRATENVGPVWNDDKDLKFFIYSEKKLFYIQYSLATHLYEIEGIDLPFDIKNIINFGFSKQGIPTFIFKSTGKIIYYKLS
jgi:hypothetical protein